jgi:hypothetical protein
LRAGIVARSEVFTLVLKVDIVTGAILVDRRTEAWPGGPACFTGDNRERPPGGAPDTVKPSSPIP